MVRSRSIVYKVKEELNEKEDLHQRIQEFIKYNHMKFGPNHNTVLVGGPKVDENTNTNPTAGNDTVSDPAAAAPATPVPVAATEAQPTTANSKPRNKSVKGAMKLARDMKAAGKTRDEIAKAVVDLYVAGGRTEKDAKYFASGTLWSVFGPMNPRLKAPATPAPAPTPQTNA